RRDPRARRDPSAPRPSPRTPSSRPTLRLRPESSARGRTMAVSPVAFYAVANEPHFLGLVALLNSLRLQGHGDPLLVADCGLAGWQRELLVPHAEVVEADRGIPPYLLKPVLPRARPTE